MVDASYLSDVLFEATYHRCSSCEHVTKKRRALTLDDNSFSSRALHADSFQLGLCKYPTRCRSYDELCERDMVRLTTPEQALLDVKGIS